MVPSESLVISAGVFAASGSEPDLVPIILAAAAGAFLGDHISYFIGRTAGSKLMERSAEGSKKDKGFKHARKLIDERGGVILIIRRHIPGARSVPWKTATKEDNTFKSAPELAKIHFEGAGVKPDVDTVAYCRIGERSSHTGIVLTYLLGLDNVRNYDGSWTEWGNKVGAPIEVGA